MSNDAVVPAEPPDFTKQEVLDAILQEGDFSRLTQAQRSQYLYHLAKSMGLNPLSKPFNLIVLNNKLTLYANRTASDQLRKIHGIKSEVLYEGPLVLGNEVNTTVYVVKTKLTGADGREETSLGAVGIDNMKGEALANQIMKCHTKALRRGTLAFAGLGFLDELEVESVRSMQRDPQPMGVGQPRMVQPTPIEPPVEPIEAELVEPKPVAAQPPAPVRLPTVKLPPRNGAR